MQGERTAHASPKLREAPVPRILGGLFGGAAIMNEYPSFTLKPVTYSV